MKRYTNRNVFYLIHNSIHFTWIWNVNKWKTYLYVYLQSISIDGYACSHCPLFNTLSFEMRAWLGNGLKVRLGALVCELKWPFDSVDVYCSSFLNFLCSFDRRNGQFQNGTCVHSSRINAHDVSFENVRWISQPAKHFANLHCTQYITHYSFDFWSGKTGAIGQN